IAGGAEYREEVSPRGAERAKTAILEQVHEALKRHYRHDLCVGRVAQRRRELPVRQLLLAGVHLQQRQAFRQPREVSPACALSGIVEIERRLRSLLIVERVEPGGRGLRYLRGDIS